MGPDVYLVADGMGGHRAGDVASRIAIETFARHPGPIDSLTELEQLVTDAHDAIRREQGADRVGMGTTLVGATPIGATGDVAVFHVGDSRCYRLAGGRLSLVTRDHTYVQELIDAGRRRPDEVAGHPLRHVVTRALGADLGGGPDVAVLPPPVGRLLLCSDGLWGELEPGTIGRVLAGIDDPGAAAARLVELALAGPARDDITAVVVDVVAVDDGDPPGAPAGRSAASMTPTRATTRETGAGP